MVIALRCIGWMGLTSNDLSTRSRKSNGDPVVGDDVLAQQSAAMPRSGCNCPRGRSITIMTSALNDHELQVQRIQMVKLAHDSPVQRPGGRTIALPLSIA